MDIIEEIIEMLKKEHKENACYIILRDHYQEYRRKKAKEYYTYTGDDFYTIYGFLYGLEATGYITEEEGDKARNYLLKKIDEKKEESL